MALTDFTRDVSQEIARMGGVYISDDGSSFNDPGRVRDVSFDWEAVTGSADTGGRQKTRAFDVTLTFTLMQSSAATLGGVASLANPTGDGLTLAFTSSIVEPDASTGAITNAEFTFHGCLPEVSGSIPFNGDETAIPVTVRGRVPVSEFQSLATTGLMTFGTGGAA